MRTDPAYRKITADEFLAMDFNTDRRFELHDGVIVMMAGGSEAHAWVQGNLYVALRIALKGSGCRPYGPDMAVRTSVTDIRYPDLSIHCGPRPDNDEAVTALDAPVAIVEVLWPGTTTLDQGTKLEEFKAIASVQAIAFVDPVNELVRTVSRHAGSGWIDTMFAAHDLALPFLDVVVPHADIFAAD